MTLDSFQEIDQLKFLQHSWLKEWPEREVFSMTMEKEYLISWRLRAEMAQNQTNSLVLGFAILQNQFNSKFY